MKPFWTQVWLIMRNDLRLQLRSSPASAYLSWALAIGVSVILHFVAIAIYATIKSPPSVQLEAMIWWFMAFVMLGVAMNAAISSLYERADFDLLLSSPVSVPAVLLARLGSTAAAGLLSVIMLVPALLDPAVFFFSPRYLAGFLVWALLAIVTAAVGMSFTLGLVRVLGARRARVVSQVIAALLGASVFVASQLPNMFIQSVGQARLRRFYAWIAEFPAFLAPAQAGRAGPEALGWLTLVVALAVGLTIWLLARTFVTGLQDISGLPAKAGKGRPHRWTEGLAAATFWKDFRLIARDPLLLAQTLPQTIFVIPMAFMWYRWIGIGVVAPLVFMMALMLSAALTAVAVAGEECWDLIRMSPVSELRLRAAKMAAGMAVPGVIVALASLGLAVAGRPGLGGLTFLVSLACSAGMSRLAVASVIPVPRKDILRARRSTSGNTVVGFISTFFFMITGGGGLFCVAWGRYPIVSASLIGLALLGAAACFAYVKFEAIVWREEARWGLGGGV